MNYLRQSWRSWLRWLSVVAAFSIACAFLSNWQFHRNHDKLVIISRIIDNGAKPAVAITTLLPRARAWNPNLEWRRVSISGNYEPKLALLVRNRPNQGQGGFEQLVPFKSDTGSTILVSRGWLPNGNSAESPAENPLPSATHRTIVVALVTSEQPDGRTAPRGQIINIDVPRAVRQLRLTSTFKSFYGRVVSDSSVDKVLPPAEAPSTDPGNNLSYAIQWIAFAVMAFGALIWMFRLERDRYLGIQRPARRKRTKPSDEDIEDSLT